MKRVGRMTFRDDGVQYLRQGRHCRPASDAPVPLWWRAQPPLAKVCWGLFAGALLFPLGVLGWLFVGGVLLAQ